MRYNIVFYFVMISIFEIQGQSNSGNDFVNFVSKFPLMEFPIKTKHFNDYETFRKVATRVNQLDQNLCATYFFQGDKSKVRSEFESFNMETGASMGKKVDQFGFYPVFRAVSNQYLLLCFMKTTLTSYEYHLAAFKAREETASDVLEINKVNEELSPDLYEFAAIEKSPRIQIFRFEQNPNFWKQKKQNSSGIVPKTLSTYSDFSMAKGKFKLNNSTTSYSTCTVGEIVSEKIECIANDPLWVQYQEVKR